MVGVSSVLRICVDLSQVCGRLDCWWKIESEEDSIKFGKVQQGRRRGAVWRCSKTTGDWWGKAANLRGDKGDWAVHIFREHNNEADAWAEKGSRMLKEEWVKEEGVVWPDVTRICRFWDLAVPRHWVCAANMWIEAFTLALGWYTVH